MTMLQIDRQSDLNAFLAGAARPGLAVCIDAWPGGTFTAGCEGMAISGSLQNLTERLEEVRAATGVKSVLIIPGTGGSHADLPGWAAWAAANDVSIAAVDRDFVEDNVGNLSEGDRELPETMSLALLGMVSSLQ